MAPAFSTAHAASDRGTGSTAPWAELVEQISTCARLLRRGLSHALTPYDISEGQFSILWACSKAPRVGIAQNELAAALGLSPAHVSGVVEQLRDRGLIHSHRGTTDRRRQLWQCTPDGATLLARLQLEVDLLSGSPDGPLAHIDLQDGRAMFSALCQAVAAKPPAPRAPLKLATIQPDETEAGDTASC